MLMATAKRQQSAPKADPLSDWFVVRVVKRTDAHAVITLRRYGFPIWYPKIFEMRPVPQRELSLAQRHSAIRVQKPIRSPMFPRYVMNHPGAALNYPVVFQEAGVRGFAFAGERMVQLTAHDIDKIRRCENGDLFNALHTPRMIFGRGEQITIASGPFASFAAVVEQSLDIPIGEIHPETRIKIAINLFGRQTAMNVEVWQVAKH